MDGSTETDPYWRDNLLFYEYFNGDNARIGASHRTGWTGLVAPLIEISGRFDARAYFEAGRAAVFARD